MDVSTSQRRRRDGLAAGRAGLSLGLLAAALAAPRATRAEGSLTGIVRVQGSPRPLPPLAVAKDASVCGKQVPNEALVLGPKGALANVVVSVRGIKPRQAPAPTANAVLDQVGCRYTPHVQAVTVGTRLALLNNDQVFHNVHGLHQADASPSRSVTVFNLAMPFKGQKLPTVLRKPGVMRLRCDAGHTWMSAYVLVFEHPHFAVTDGAGRFTIRGLPAGEHTIELWHEPLEAGKPPLARTSVVKITDGQVTTIEPTLEL